MLRFLAVAIVLTTLLPMPTNAQVPGVGTFVTIGQVRQGLNEALKGVQEATVTAGSEARALGNSLQANVQNVIADIDARFAKRLDYTFEKLDQAERQFMSDARDLIFKTSQAAIALSKQVGDETRTTIGEADIAAYNASYSLPCRTQTPRIVYWSPMSSIARGEEIVISVHGNFLNFGNAAQVLVNDQPSKSFSRTDRIISVTLDKATVGAITDTASIRVVITGLKKRVLEPRFMSWLFGCSENYEDTEQNSLTVTLQPRVSYHVQGELWATYQDWSPEASFQSGRLQRSDGNCDHDENVSFNICVPPQNMKVTRGTYSISSKSGPSSFGPTTLSGNNCIHFAGRLKGSGYNWVLGVKNCQGSAWLDANWEVFAQSLLDKASDRIQFKEQLPIGQYSYAKNATQAPKGENWRWRFIAQIEQRRGSQVLSTETLTDGRQDNGRGWMATIKDGVLTLTLPPEVS